jgi:very-short-patch-repair endonuclease
VVSRDTVASIVVAAFEEGREQFQHLPEALDWLVAWAIIRRSAEVNRPIFNRTGDQLAMDREHFAAADRARLSHDAKRVQKAVLARPVPEGNAYGSRKEWTDNSLLQNEFVKQKRHIPVRDLLDRAGNAVLALTPCLMMSPLTVAQYLRPTGIAFDLVIMDEASQIKPEDSLGAMLRSRQAVIVGDPKQLPPTSFFDRAIEEAEDDDESVEDDGVPHLSSEDRVAAESVLDLALRAFRPARRLRWHYRSQHESLIAFSNREFYNNDLVVFPSSHAPSDTLGIELVRVRGFWRERINQEEAQTVVGAAADFMRHYPKLSLGIVAMNQPQRELIQAELDLLIAGDSALARYVEHWEERLESLFVKNLENVQGDERDVIFISLGWGPTPEGALHQRFYPVNRRQDGHRRLNVLFTRAKRKIVLFSSLDAENILIDPERSAPGVRILRDYLTYARDGRLEKGTEDDGEADSPFETSVANALRALGHNVALQVGVAGYRVDLAVRHPVEPARFVLGIECDGAAYHSAKSARDRDRLRQEALERLGWTLVRVWSTDWFRDPFAQAQRLSSAINVALSTAVLQQTLKKRLVELADSDPFPSAQVTARQTATRPKTSVGTPEAAPENPIALELPSPSPAPRPPTLIDALRAFREDVIMRDFPGSEPGRCILREAIIEVLVRSGLDEPEDFHHKVPEYLRSRTDGRQVTYLPNICDLVVQYQVRAYTSS